MKKYIISLVIASVFLISAPFAVNQASAADMSIRDFINLLVAIGVITPEKMPAVNAYLATLDNNQITSTSSVKIISPNGGEIITAGDDYIVKWWDDRDAGNTNIYAVNQTTGVINTIVNNSFGRSSGIDGNFSYQWKVSSSIAPGKYKLKICKSEKNECGIGNNYFTIVANLLTSPLITVLSPNGGETFRLSSPITIKWSQNFASYATITILGDDGWVYSSLPIKFEAGVNTWIIPANTNIRTCTASYCDTTKGYKIRITTDNQPGSGHAGEFMNDESDNYFTIIFS